MSNAAPPALGSWTWWTEWTRWTRWGSSGLDRVDNVDSVDGHKYKPELGRKVALLFLHFLESFWLTRSGD